MSVTWPDMVREEEGTPRITESFVIDLKDLGITATTTLLHVTRATHAEGEPGPTAYIMVSNTADAPEQYTEAQLTELEEQAGSGQTFQCYLLKTDQASCDPPPGTRPALHYLCTQGSKSWYTVEYGGCDT